MSDMHITVEAGKTKRLLTEGKLCDKNIVVEASGDGYSQGFEAGQNAVTYYCTNVRWKSLNWLNKANATINLPICDDVSYLVNPSSEEHINTTVEHLTVNVSKPIPSMIMLLQCGYNYRDQLLKSLTLNIDTSNAVSFYYAFANYLELVTIGGTPLDFSKTTDATGVFHNGYKLADVRFVKGSIKVDLPLGTNNSLSNESIQSVIDGLADMTGKSAKTLTLHATVGGKLTQAQKDAISAKNWTLVY